MSNMSYCRFQNTYGDAAECLDALEQQKELSGDEYNAARNMFLEFLRFCVWRSSRISIRSALANTSASFAPGGTDMANCLEITLWYPEDKFNALSTALEPAGSSVEEELGRVLTELYERLVPSEQRVEIAEKLAREEQHEAEERVRHEAETYRVSVLKLTAGRACEYHKLTRAWDLLALAAFIRETVRKSPSSPSGDFRSRLGETERLSTQDFAELSMARFRNDPHVNGAFQVDFPSGRFSFVMPGEGWRSYALKDISAAIYKAGRKSGLSKLERLHRFFDALTDKLYFTSEVEWNGGSGDV